MLGEQWELLDPKERADYQKTQSQRINKEKRSIEELNEEIEKYSKWIKNDERLLERLPKRISSRKNKLEKLINNKKKVEKEIQQLEGRDLDKIKILRNSPHSFPSYRLY